MTNKPPRRNHVHTAIIAAMVGVLAVPTAMTGLFQSIDDDGINVVPVQDLRQEALQDAARVRRLRREYWRAVNIYNELVRMGLTNLAPPDINTVETIEYYLTPENFADTDIQALVHAAAEEEGTQLRVVSDARVRYNTLLERYQNLLDGYITSGYCPESLRQYHLFGFYELCRTLLDEQMSNIQPALLDRSAYLRGFQSVGYAPLRNLRNRLQNLEESLIYEDGTSVRPRSHDGFRPHLNRFD